jgi:putative DNA primase/helicase
MKGPRLKNWPSRATTDPKVIRGWYAKDPRSNLAIATGRGFFALDIDHKSGGFESLAALEAEHGPLPPTVTAITGGGGRHYLYRYDVERFTVCNSTKVRPGIDTRGDGGCIVAAPSLHPSGRRYEWGTPPSQPMAYAPGG